MGQYNVLQAPEICPLHFGGLSLAIRLISNIVSEDGMLCHSTQIACSLPRETGLPTFPSVLISVAKSRKAPHK